jgi:hypothetical protein
MLILFILPIGFLSLAVAILFCSMFDMEKRLSRLEEKEKIKYG